MTSPRRALYWIVGSGGLLGSRLRAAISRDASGSQCWVPPFKKFSWNAPRQLQEEFAESARQFGRVVRECPDGCDWGVVWAAGAGVIGTSEQVFAAETDTLQVLLNVVDAHLLNTPAASGLIFLSSSAGGVYGNCPDQTITEHSECRPISPYGANKQKQEELLNAWADDRPQVTCRIGRISNLYGTGQNLSKPQGLMSHISKCLIWQRPIHIYVPLDTIRDYVHVDDCARQIVSCLSDWMAASEPKRGGRVKIFAAEQPMSVAEIVGAFTRLASRRRPRVICAPSALGLQQPRRLLFRSVVAPCVKVLPSTTLQVGLHQLHQYQLALYHQGRLAPPQIKT